MSRHNIPRPFKGENRIFYIFTKKSLFYTSIGTGIGLILLKVFSSIDLPLAGLIACVIITIPFYAFGSYTYSKDILYNGGEDFDKVFFRKLKKSFSKKLYITNFDEK